MTADVNNQLLAGNGWRFFKQVLSFVLCEHTPLDSMCRTLVVASHTLNTRTTPFGMITGIQTDILIRASLNTTATSNTRFIGLEVLGVDEEAVEERTNDTALGPSKASRNGVEPTTPVDDIIDNLIHTTDGID